MTLTGRANPSLQWISYPRLFLALKSLLRTGDLPSDHPAAQVIPPFPRTVNTTAELNYLPQKRMGPLGDYPNGIMTFFHSFELGA